MKKLLLSLSALFALCEGATAQRMTVDDMEALPGETVSLNMSLDTDGGSYMGLEFDIQFPCAGFSTTEGATTTREGWDGVFTIGDVGGVKIENLARAGVLSYSATDIPGEGLLPFGTVEFTVGKDIPLGDYTVTLCNMTLIGDRRVSVPDASFTLHVVSIHTMTLDENSTTAPTKSNGAVNVTVKRTIPADVWATICLPFSMTEEQVKEAFGDDVQLADFKGCNTTKDEDENVIGITVNFADVTAIEANHPYIIKVSDLITEFTVDGVNVNAIEEPSVDCDEMTVKVGKNTYTSYNRFIGTYTAQTEVPEKCLFLSNNKFWYATEETQPMKAYRAYFDFYDVLSEVENASSRMNMVFNNETTGISETMNYELRTMNCFDLQGRPVISPKKGLYIKNGKKHVNK